MKGIHKIYIYMGEKKETWAEYFMKASKPITNRAIFWRDNIIRAALMACTYLSVDQIKAGLLSA